MLAKTLFSLFIIATSSLMVRAAAIEEKAALDAIGRPNNGQNCEPLRENRECLGLCECPPRWNSYISLLNQVQCQEVLKHGCERSIIVPITPPVSGKRVDQDPFAGVSAIRISFNEVCVSNHIFVRPHCHYPICLESIVSAFLDDPTTTFAAILAVIEQGATALDLDNLDEFLVARIEAAILSVRGIIFRDGGLGVAGYLTTDDCRHQCQAGYAAALEIIVRPFDQFFGPFPIDG